MANEMMYNDPVGGTDSTIGSQIRTDYFYKKALVEAAKEQYFGQMADVRAMPKNMGKTIKQYHYLPIMDDRNLNDMGIDAAGAAGSASTSNFYAYIKVVSPQNVSNYTAQNDVSAENEYDSVAMYFRGQGTDDATALEAAKGAVVAWALNNVSTAAAAITDVAADPDTSFGEIVTLTGANMTAGTLFTAGYGLHVIDATNDSVYGNFYGSSKDVGQISGKFPALSESGGRVNRVGMKRIELEGTIEKFGFFTEYTQESMDFDSDAELMMHLTSEVVKAANELTEDQLQVDLLNAAGVLRYPGSATSVATIGATMADAADPAAANDVVTYDDLVKLAIELDQNRCPKNTKLIAGSRMVDTKVVNAARYIYIGSELLPTIMRMTDYHGNKAFIPVAQYASAGSIARGEVGAIDTFRFIVVPEMMHWAGAGAAVATADEDTVYRSSVSDAGDISYDVYPLLVVGDGSFATIGFQTNGKTVKFKTKHVPPSQNYSTQDPYGETGFYSIKWYYGFMALRPERIALTYSLAEW